MLVIAIDPGITGGVAIVGDAYAEVHAPPVHTPGERKRINVPELARVLRRAWTVPEFNGLRDSPQAVIEFAQSMPGEGAVGAFSYGMGYGVYHGVLVAMGVPPLVVHSRKWKKALGLSSDKAESLALAREVFPGFRDALKLKGSDGKAEALLIARWFRGCFPTRAAQCDVLPDVEL